MELTDKEKLEKEIRLRMRLCGMLAKEGEKNYNEGALDGMMEVLACYDQDLYQKLSTKWLLIKITMEEEEKEKNKAKNKDHPRYYVCPICERDATGYCNVYKAHWFYCSRCLVTWCEGENLFSSWTTESPDDWEENKAFLRRFKVVK
ncbi:MAG: hypothetical protein ACUVSK_13395 [Desulfotomaculales bacterium]